VRPWDMKVLVEGLNLVRRHRRPRKAGQKGQIVSLPRPVSISSAALVCPNCAKPVRVGFQKSETSKLRVCKRCKNTFS
jgi:large subunit ribosomal protein L24